MAMTLQTLGYQFIDKLVGTIQTISSGGASPTVMEGQFDWDPPGLHHGDMVEEKIGIPNVAWGDFVRVSASTNLWGTHLSGYVSNPHEVTVQLSSHRKYYLDTAFTVYVRVERRIAP